MSAFDISEEIMFKTFMWWSMATEIMQPPQQHQVI